MSSYLLVQGFMAIVVAPSLGLLKVRPGRQLSIVLALVSLPFLAHVLSTDSSDAPVIISTHLTLASAGFAFSAVARFFRALLEDDLDALGATALVGVLACGGIILLGDLAATLPPQLLQVGLLVSPIITAAGAAGFDVFRSGFLYSLSPLAHLDIHYPSWQAASVVYSGVAVAASIAATFTQRKRTTVSQRHHPAQ